MDVPLHNSTLTYLLLLLLPNRARNLFDELEETNPRDPIHAVLNANLATTNQQVINMKQEKKDIEETIGELENDIAQHTNLSETIASLIAR